MNESVQPSSLATQPIGAVSRVLEGVYQLKLPVPFPLKFVASYLVSDGSEGGWTVIDPGFDYPPAREAWESGAAGLGLDFERDISRIIVTHLHPDHIGLARWMEERSGAPVFMMAEEIESARRVWSPASGTEDFTGFLIRNGMDPHTAEATAGGTRLGVRLPERLIPLQSGDTIELGGSEARVIHAPGHTDFHFVLHDERRRLLFGGDHVLLEITPNVGVYSHTVLQPLQRYTASLKELRELDVDLVLPGHGPLFRDLSGRADEILQHHEERLSVMHSALSGEAATPFEITRRVFSEDLSDHQLRFALAETLAHLEYLAEQGRAEPLDGPVVRYQAS